MSQRLSSSRSSTSARAPSIVFIRGATGPYSARINGAYDRTSEMSDGYPVYVGRCDASMCIEHFDGVRWQVKLALNKGTGRCWASVPGGCALEACTSRLWRVHDGKNYNHQPSLQMATGAEAEHAVSGPCISTPHKPCARSNTTPEHFPAAARALSRHLHEAR